jgi:hypothetical protein
VTFDDAAKALTYDAASGLLRWTAAERERRRSDVAGTVAANGYVMIRLAGKVRLGHRLAWLLHYGAWPTFAIDHINGNRSDNRIANLRDVPHAANVRNAQHGRRDPMLVGAVRDGEAWRAVIHRYGEAQTLGEFKTPDEANAAWVEAKKWVTDPDRPRPRVRLR